MLEEYVIPGARIDIVPSSDRFVDDAGEQVKEYASKVYDIVSEDRIDVMMPIEKGKLILLPVDGKYNVVFYSDKGLFQCIAKVTDRYRSNNMYILTLDLMSGMQKLQRRQYYRFSCAIPFEVRLLTPDEQQEYNAYSKFTLDEEAPMKKGVIVDISGGGIRFVSDIRFDAEELIVFRFSLEIRKKVKKYCIIGNVLRAEEMENRQGVFEHRVQFKIIAEDCREDIIHYIFMEERKVRKKQV